MKINNIFFWLILVFTVCGCKKQYTCICEGPRETVGYVEYKMTKKSANKWCSSIYSTSTYSCSLK